MCRRIAETIHVGIHGKEAVRLVELRKECAARVLDAFFVELQVVPRLRICNHVPAQWVAAILADGLEGVNGIAEALGHLQPVLVEYKTIADDVLERHAVEHHCCDGVERVEPSARLIDALSYEVGGEQLSALKDVLVLKRIMYLRVGHGTTVEPHVDEVGFAAQWLPCLADKHDVVHIGAMEVYAFVVLLRIVARHESLVAQRVRRHESSLHAAVYFRV